MNFALLVVHGLDPVDGLLVLAGVHGLDAVHGRAGLGQPAVRVGQRALCNERRLPEPEALQHDRSPDFDCPVEVG